MDIMEITIFSFLTSIFFFNGIVIIISLLRKNEKLICTLNTHPLLVAFCLALARIAFTFEFPFTKVINLKFILNNLCLFFRLHLWNSISIFDVFVFIWMFITAFLFIRLIFSYKNFKKFIKNININKQNIKYNYKVLSKVKKELNIKEQINIVQSNSINSPMVIGIKKGTIYLPNIEFTAKELRYIYIHELSHFRSKDFLKKGTVQFLKILFWWNPFMHKFAKDFNHILEIQCDFKSTKNMLEADKKEYLGSILKVLEYVAKKDCLNDTFLIVPSLITSSRKEDLKQRLKLIISTPKSDKKYLLVYFVVFLLFILSYLIVFQPYYPIPKGEWIQIETFN